MDRDTFWSIIDDARKTVADTFHIAPAVTAKLRELSGDEIVSFKQHQYQLLDESYRWDLWAVGYIVNGGCSDDGFDYFRAWLIANGRERWETAMKSPEAIGDWADPNATEYEEMLYVAVEAYEAETGEDFPYDKLAVSRPSEPAGEPWDEEQLQEVYPTLCEKFF